MRMIKNKIKDKIKDWLRVSGYGIYKIPEYGRHDSHYRFPFYKALFDSIHNIEGDVVECGVGVGNTFSTFAGLVKDEGAGRTLYGFDSFEGFPEPSIHDQSPRNPKKGEWNKSTPEMILKLLGERSIDKKFIETRVKLIKGFVQDSLTSYNGNIAFLHLDVDLYDSYKCCLENLYPKVTQGGVIIFDEYKNDIGKWPGATKAIDEFLGDKKQFIRFDSIVNRYFYYKQ